MSKETLTEEEKSTLSKEELEALEEGEEETADLEDLADDDDEADEEPEESDDEGEEEPGEEDEEPESEAEADEEQEAEAETEEEAEAEADEDRAFVPQHQPKDVEDYDNKMKAIGDELAGIENKFSELDKALEAGDKTVAEARAEDRKLNARKLELTEQRSELRAQHMQAEREIERNQQAAEQFWAHEQKLFFDDHPEYYDKEKGKDGKEQLVPNPVMMGALDATVKRLAGKEENANRTGMWFLKEAHRIVSSKFAPKEAPAADDKEKEKDKGKKPVAEKKPIPKDKQRKANLKVVPKTLGNVPAADDNDTGNDGEFSHLDKLAEKGGMEFEEALSKLTPAQQDRYLKSA